MNADAPRRPPGMHDVAALAGVSHQTVSRVLNDHPSVRPETRDKVLAPVATLNYRRNSAARALVTRRTGVVGVVTPATALYGPSSTLLGLEEAARLSGLYVSVATVRNFEAETMKRILEHFFDQGVDGVAVIAPTVEIVDVLAGTRSDVPLVMVSSAAEVPPAEHLSAVGVDQRHGAVLATGHLLEHHREVLHVAGPQDWFDARDRVTGWQETLAAAGAAVPELIVAGWSASAGYEIGCRLVREGLPEAIFAANDQLALGLLHAFAEHQVRVPDDVALVGFDDEVGSEHYWPPLTTVRQDFATLGSMGIQTLLRAQSGEAPERGVLAPWLVVRESSRHADADPPG